MACRIPYDAAVLTTSFTGPVVTFLSRAAAGAVDRRASSDIAPAVKARNGRAPTCRRGAAPGNIPQREAIESTAVFDLPDAVRTEDFSSPRPEK
jgi:hypothetical protein